MVNNEVRLKVIQGTLLDHVQDQSTAADATYRVAIELCRAGFEPELDFCAQGSHQLRFMHAGVAITCIYDPEPNTWEVMAGYGDDLDGYYAGSDAITPSDVVDLVHVAIGAKYRAVPKR